VEAYPDVANNYVEIITQWPGISAEQIEQQVTIPLEIVMNGIPARGASALVLAVRPLRPEADFRRRIGANDWNREKVLERLSQVTLPPGVQPQMGTDWSPVGQIYFFTLHSTNPQVRRDGAEVARRLGGREEVQVRAERRRCGQLRRPTREYQVRVDPNKLISYGLSIGQVEQQLTNNNANAGGSFHRSRPAADQRARSGAW
jgi:heavy metal efflux system protein